MARGLPLGLGRSSHYRKYRANIFVAPGNEDDSGPDYMAIGSEAGGETRSKFRGLSDIPFVINNTPLATSEFV